MINGFTLVLMTKNFQQQLNFYLEILNLDLIYQLEGMAGIGKNNQLYLVMRHDDSEDSHHLAHNENKGPQIMCFKCQGEMAAVIEKITHAGYKIRDKVKVPEINSYYVFIEDFDGNEICLDFVLA